MRKDQMGNQNTSGIVEEEKTANEAVEKAQEVSSQDDLKEENKKLSEDDENKEFQEKDSHDDDEADKSPPGEKGLEEANGLVNGCETRPDALHDVSSTFVETKKPNLEDGITKLSDEVHDQLRTLNGEIRTSEKDTEQKSSSTIVISSILPHEADNIPSELQEDQSMIIKETDETLGLIHSGHVEEEDHLVDAEVEQNSEINEHDVADTGIVEGPLLEMCVDKEDDGMINSVDNIENGLPETSSQDLSGNEKKDEFLAVDEEKLMENVLDNMSCVDENRPNEVKNTNEVNQTGDAIPMAQKQEDKSTDETILENEDKPFLKINDNERKKESIMDKCESDEPQFLSEIKEVVEYDNTDEALCSIINDTSSCAPLALCSPRLPEEAEIPTKGDESREKRFIEQVELRKSPSFDFGLNARCEESDQTPLLYQDNKSAMRSLSSCSALRFQSRSVQTEFLGTNTKYEEVEVEEKTITMERSTSESLRIPSLNLVGQENGLKANSPSREDIDVISPKGYGKRKPRSSLFATCLCCTTAIS